MYNVALHWCLTTNNIIQKFKKKHDNDKHNLAKEQKKKQIKQLPHPSKK